MRTHSLFSTFVCSGVSIVALAVSGPEASAATLAEYFFTAKSPAPSNVSANLSVSDYATLGGTGSGFSSTGTQYAYMQAAVTGTTNDPSGDFYHEFSVTVQNLAVGQTLNLTSLQFAYSKSLAETGGAIYVVGVYSDLTGYVSKEVDRLANFTATTTDTTVATDLTNTNSVAGSAFTGLTNGQTVEFRLYFGDNRSTTTSQRIDNLAIIGAVVPEPSAAALIGLAGSILLLVRRRP